MNATQRLFPFAPELNPTPPSLQACVLVIAETWRRRFTRDVCIGTEKWKKLVRKGWIRGAVLDHPNKFVDFAVAHADGILASERRANENLAAALATFEDPDR